ncbi:MAG: hypothetical protein VYE73_09470 [Acidobacteriota bacterium]|nr:hypothetical protein [Acidobacteriota bacterium]
MRVPTAWFAVALVTGALAGQETDPDTGLVKARGFADVVQHCTECHDASLIRQTRARREEWRGLLEWMTSVQEMEPLDEQVERGVLDYLATNYGPKTSRQRRPPLPDHLLPPAR